METGGTNPSNSFNNKVQSPISSSLSKCSISSPTQSLNEAFLPFSPPPPLSSHNSPPVQKQTLNSFPPSPPSSLPLPNFSNVSISPKKEEEEKDSTPFGSPSSPSANKSMPGTPNSPQNGNHSSSKRGHNDQNVKKERNKSLKTENSRTASEKVKTRSTTPNAAPSISLRETLKVKPLPKLPDAPVFYPTEEEFLDPMKYIESIRERGSKYGIAKIVPPSDKWLNGKSFTSVINFDTYIFQTKGQTINELFRRNGPSEVFMRELFEFSEKSGKPMRDFPMINGEDLDLRRLYESVVKRGGFLIVSQKRMWNEVAKDMELQSEPHIAYILRINYRDYLYLYEASHRTPKTRKEEEHKSDDAESGKDSDSEKDEEKLFMDSGVKMESRLLSKTAVNTKKKMSATKAMEFGYDDGNMFTLKSFKTMADEFKKKWFSDTEPTEEDIENTFWHIVESGAFRGRFNDNKFSYGTYTWPNHRVYTGEWNNVYRHGKGHYSWPDGRTYEGNWKKDKRHGEGIYTWDNGDQFVGNFAEGKRKGLGILRLKSGDVYEQLWNEDRFDENFKGTQSSPIVTAVKIENPHPLLDILRKITPDVILNEENVAQMSKQNPEDVQKTEEKMEIENQKQEEIDDDNNNNNNNEDNSEEGGKNSKLRSSSKRRRTVLNSLRQSRWIEPNTVSDEEREQVVEDEDEPHAMDESKDN
eukprot:TRINITY_DN4622_c0_g1_i3.p1 TRINITY_DN4622_c0_g1~~TRINITY_DN4622_c0_g1_i3.p1  ORF type:complete len:697 (+),score=246.78 TRINITY_DN4622_c0_g1_i3:186-2276(+)